MLPTYSAAQIKHSLTHHSSSSIAFTIDIYEEKEASLLSTLQNDMILKKKQLQERLRVKRLRRDSEIVDGAKEAYDDDDDDATEEKDEGRKIDNVSPMIMLMMIGYDNDDDDDYNNANDSDI